MNEDSSIIKICNSDIYVYYKTCIYALIKNDLENTKLFNDDDIKLSFLNINNKFNDDIDIIQISYDDKFKSYNVRYLKEIKTKHSRYMIFFSKETTTKVWEMINYRLFQNKKL